MKRLLFLMVAAVFSASAFGVLVTDDMGAPFRGDPGSTMQAWTFDEPVTPATPLAPDVDQNPVGPASLQYYPGATVGWQADYMGRIGVVPLSGALFIDIPNFPEQNPYKDILVQVVWSEQTPFGDPEVTAVMVDDMPVEIGGKLVDEVVLKDGWMHSTFLIHLEPNPAFEKIMIGGSVYVDQVIIDTICVPEPATMAILGLGAFFLKRRKA